MSSRLTNALIETIIELRRCNLISQEKMQKMIAKLLSDEK